MFKAIISKISIGMLAVVLTASVVNGEGVLPPNKIEVLKIRKILLVRSYFSQTQDVLLYVATGRNNQINFSRSYLVPRDAKMEYGILKKATFFHGAGDDVPPWRLNDTYIGGNHGYGFNIEITSPKHGLTTADLGSAWLDEAQNKFYLIKVVDNDKIWILSENKHKGDIWKFVNKVTGNTLKRPDGKQLPIAKRQWKQIYPACRILKQSYLVDGKTPLNDNIPVRCDYLDVIDEYDIISPASLLANVVANAGKKINFVGGDLESMIHNQITYRFQPRGTCVICHRAEVLKEFKLGYMGFTQAYPMSGRRDSSFNTLEEYIPKTVPFERDGVSYNFKNIQDITAASSHRFYFNTSQGNLENPKNLPDRFIQFLGSDEKGQNKRKVGFAIGYSLLSGMTTPNIRSKNTNYAFRMIRTRKSYPVAIAGKHIKRGTKFDATAYRIYFSPNNTKKPTCVYWYPEKDYHVLYIDYHQAVDNDVVTLPAELIGKKITIVEKTPTVILHTKGNVPKEGLALSVKDSYGTITLKLTDD